MTANDNSKVVTFAGQVIARQDDLIITCEVMKVHYSPKQAAPAAPAGESSTPVPAGETAAETLAGRPEGAPPPIGSDPAPSSSPAGQSPAFSGGQEIEKVECEGTVQIYQGDRQASGQKALYLAKAKPRRLILTGDARVWQGKNVVTGHEVTYFLDENRSQVESQNNSRVRAFYEQSKGESSGK